MNIETELLADPIQSKAKAAAVAAYACTSETAFEALIRCFISDNYRLAQRAAHSVSIAACINPDLIVPYIGLLIEQLKRTDVHDAVIRNSARILEDISIPEAYHGALMDACFGFVQNRQAAIAIRVFSLTILFNLSRIYPDIKNELRYLITESMPFESAAFRSRGKKILAQI